MKQSKMERVTVTIDRGVKDQAKLVFKACNTNMQDAVGHFLQECVSRGTLPFRINRNASDRGAGMTEGIAKAFGVDRTSWPVGTNEKCNLVVRIDPELYKKAMPILEDWGMSPTAAVAMFLKQSVFDSAICC
ncbi:hypothetical protein H6A23_05790 [Olsenella uli]|uniref:hypothetical protein n=1 Tax=Olsenella uli TaxID=133926 RepID=UPI00195729AB|nr:hypothetical protein [Olsenella uli]MBM6816676.1 hypothetical protein [Olsenella uli]